MEDKLISIIVPVFNVEQYLDTCVESIIRQTYTNWELILVNDGSCDKSPAICDAWGKADPRIKVIHKPNGGASSARNAGLAAARGEYIGFVDSDDFISNRMYSILADALDNTEKKMVSCVSTRVSVDGTINPGTGMCEKRNLNTTQGLKAILKGEIGISMCSKLFRRSVFDTIRFPEGESYEELPMVIPLLIESSGILHTGIPLYHYRARENSVTDLNWKKCAYITLKRLQELRSQIDVYGMAECVRAYAVYEGKSAFSMAILLDKHYNEIDDQGKQCLKAYIQIMRKRMICVFTSGTICGKDILLYLLIVTRTLRPLYRMLGRM